MTLDEAIAHYLEVAEQNETQADKIGRQFIGSAMDKRATDCRECATDHRQLAEWLSELKQWRRVCGVCPSYEMCIPECKEGYNAQIAEYKWLLRAAVDDFAKFDRENAKNKNCMMPEMDCADCPLSWDSVDDRVEPCHSWRYANEALNLLNDEKINNVE